MVERRPGASWKGDLVTERDVARDAGDASPGRRWAIAGLVLAGLGLAMFPLGGLVGVVCGGIARSKGDHSLGLVTIVVSVLSFFASFLVAAWVIG
jgi:hypothetical protein